MTNKDQTGKPGINQTEKIDKSKETILVITVALLVIHLIFHKKTALYGALVIGLSGIFSTFLAQKIDWLWSKLSELLSTISNYILLTALFFFILTPMGLLRRLLKKDDFGRPKNTTGDSNFHDRNHEYTARDLENTW